jgi:hypothetical protein
MRAGTSLATRRSGSADTEATMVTDERTRDEDLVYEIEPDVQAELLKYPGKWAALTPTKLLAIADTSTEAYKAGRALGVESPILYLVPDHRAGYSY